MTSDLNKGITSISYNYLNLPEEIYWSSGKKINYLYNATGQKVQKKVTDGTTLKIVDYLDGFQYTGEVLQFFPTAEGYVNVTTAGMSLDGSPNAYYYNYVYNYTDHLGNIRLSYTKDPVTNQLKILEENNYYPFGLKHSVYNTTKMDYKDDPGGGGGTVITHVRQTDYQYKYNGKELQDELGLGLYDYGARMYDPALGRWNVIDPMAEMYYSHSTYNYTANNPVFFIDPNGMNLDVYEMDDQGNLTNIAESDRDVVYASKNFEGEGENRTLKADNDGGVDVGEKGFIEQNKGAISFNYGGKSQTHDFINFGSNEDKALEFFKYAAENTNVEFNVFTENGTSFSGTSHSGNFVYNNVSNYENVSLYGHSHPVEGSYALEPSGANISIYSNNEIVTKSVSKIGDMGNIIKNNYKITPFIYAPNFIEGAKTVFYDRNGVISPIKDGFQPK